MYSLSSFGNVSQPLILKILKSSEQQRKGFIGWKRPPKDYFGMLFLHSKVKPQAYHMTNVPFDLDCIGLDEENKVIEVMTLKALTKAPKRFSNPVCNVVEVRGGWCQRHDLKGGESLLLMGEYNNENKHN